MRFTFESVFGRFFRLIGDNIVLFAVLGLVLNVLPVLASNMAMFSFMGVTQQTWALKAYQFTVENWATGIGITLVAAAFNIFSMALITEIAIVRAVGKPADIGTAIQHSLGNIVPLFIIGLMVTLIMIGGFLLLIVPGIMFIMAACVAIPAYVGQPGLGLWGAVQRSFELTKGHRWMIFAIFLVFGIVVGIISNVVMRPMLGGTLAEMTAGNDPGLGFFLVQSLVGGALGLLNQVFVVALYICLRETKDKLAPDQAASLFE